MTYCLNKKGKLCKRLGERGQPTPIDENELKIYWMKTNKLSLEEAEAEIEALKNTLREPVDNIVESLSTIIDSYKPLKGFKVFQSTKKVVVWEQFNETVIIGSFENLTAKVLDNILSEHDPELYSEFTREMAPVINPKNHLTVSDTDVLEFTLNYLKPKQTLPRISMDTDDIQPSLLEGIEKPSLHKIPYKKLNVSINSLNYYLKNFLERVDNHKHLCAVIYGQFIGKQWPYICYLYGKEGREGKTQFINMVGRLSKSFANLTDDSRFSLFSLYGKSIILVPENDKARLMSSKTIKAITGGSILQIEEKGKTGFSGNILGTIMVDANHPLKISGRNFETDRLRYFTVNSHNIHNDKRLSPSQYLKELSSTPNEFLNYCRNCFEELETEGGLLREPENHKATMSSLMDEEQDYEYNLILEKAIYEMKYHLKEGLESPKNEFLHKVKSIFSNKKDFYSTSFIHFMERKGITVEGKNFIGMGYISDGHTTIRKVKS